MRVKVLSWNIWKGFDLEGVVKLLKKENPDIIGLQEVKEVNNKNQATKVADSVGQLNYFYFRAFKTDRHAPSFVQGDAIISKFELEPSPPLFLSDLSEYTGTAETEPRTLGFARIKAGDRSLNIYVTHLGYTPNFSPSVFRHKQTQRLIEKIDIRDCILMGDFNSPLDSKEVSLISKILKRVSGNEPNFRIRDHGRPEKKLTPSFRIDHIFTSSKFKVIEEKVIKDYSSDHFPITATLEI